MLALVMALAVEQTSPPRCFDWAIVGRIEKQTFLGSPDLDLRPNEISLNGLFRWDVRPRQVVVGGPVPRRLEFETITHTFLVRQATRQVALFLARTPDGAVKLTRVPQILAPDVRRSAWKGVIEKIIADEHLSKCAA